MNTTRNCARTRLSSSALLVCVVLWATFTSTATRAADGCLVLLCLAAPSWKNIAQCVDPVREVLKDLAKGKPFPSCSMSGAGNSAGNRWSSAPAYCPVQYTAFSYGESTTTAYCTYDGAIEVNVSGSLWSRTWWHLSGGDTVTEYTDAAKTQLGTWDTRFDDDYAAWLAAQPPTEAPRAGD